MLEEMGALKKYQTWAIVFRPKGVIPVSCKWVFDVKYKADGTLEKYKVKLVAKRYIQSYGIDYFETFSMWQR